MKNTIKNTIKRTVTVMRCRECGTMWSTTHGVRKTCPECGANKLSVSDIKMVDFEV